MAKLAIAKELTNDLCRGKIVGWMSELNGYVPLFVRPKEIDPITGEILQWRVIRDGTFGSEEYPSINMLTGDDKARIKLFHVKELLNYCYVFYLLWGRGFYLAKTD